MTGTRRVGRDSRPGMETLVSVLASFLLPTQCAAYKSKGDEASESRRTRHLRPSRLR